MKMLYQLFSKTIKYGRNTRLQKVDGLERWNKIKPILLKSTTQVVWKQDFKNHYDYMIEHLKLTEDEMDHEIWEKNHFFIQHARIPKNNRATLSRLIQIAFNIGQLEALWDDEFYTQEMKEYYQEQKLNNINTYIDIDHLNILDNSITKKILEELNKIL